MLTEKSQKDLKWALKASLLEHAKRIPNKNNQEFVKNFIRNEATYEQLLNLAINPYRDQVYLESEKLEKVAFHIVKEQLDKKPSSMSMLESFILETTGTTPEKIQVAPVAEPAVSPTAPAAAPATQSKVWQTTPQDPWYKRALGYAVTKPAGLIQTGLQKVGAQGAANWVGANQGWTALGVGAGTALAGYLIYRKMVNAGKDRKEAAVAAASAAKTPQERQYWLQKAR